MSAYDEVPNTTGTPASPNYSYDTNHPHAVSAKTVDATRSNSYGYDALGNMVTRNYWQPDLATASWVQHNQALQYNAENKLTTVQEGGATIASFVYDGAGSRVLGTVNGETIAYVGAHYEVNVTSGAVTKYYGGNALKKNGNLQYLFKDHLGSVVGSLDANSGVIESQRSYKPFGDDLLMRGTIPTTLGYTGQRQEPELGLYFYNARWYDPHLGRFTQPDTIVPSPVDAKAFDRYAYVNNNPVRYNDPSGHMCSDPEDPTPSCDGSGKTVVGGKVIQGKTVTGGSGTSTGTGSNNNNAGTGTSAEPNQTQGGGQGAGDPFIDPYNPTGELRLRLPESLNVDTPYADFDGKYWSIIPPHQRRYCNEEYTQKGVANYCLVDRNGNPQYYAIITDIYRKNKLISLLNNQKNDSTQFGSNVSYAGDLLSVLGSAAAAWATQGASIGYQVLAAVVAGGTIQTAKYAVVSTNEANKTDDLTTHIAGYIPSHETPILVTFTEDGYISVSYEGINEIQKFRTGTNRSEFLLGGE
ncbi:MAG TPA: RHS repeat-associated core domain-containing protein [Anaerolineales bacterium]|nr:RHS repeat-associated core domain-containing protein [Anaerolineales bacterium]